MAKTQTLFDLKPFTTYPGQRGTPRRPRNCAIEPNVWEALKRLKFTLDTKPRRRRHKIVG